MGNCLCKEKKDEDADAGGPALERLEDVFDDASSAEHTALHSPRTPQGDKGNSRLLALPDKLLVGRILTLVEARDVAQFERASRHCQRLVHDNLHQLPKLDFSLSFYFRSEVHLGLNMVDSKPKKFIFLRILNEPNDTKDLSTIEERREAHLTFMKKECVQAPGEPPMLMFDVLGRGAAAGNDKLILAHLFKKFTARLAIRDLTTFDCDDYFYRTFTMSVRDSKMLREVDCIHLRATDHVFPTEASAHAVLNFLLLFENPRKLTISDPIIEGTVKTAFFEQLPAGHFEKLEIGTVSRTKVEFGDALLLGQRSYDVLALSACAITPTGINAYLKQFVAGQRYFKLLDVVMLGVKGDEDDVWRALSSGLDWPNRRVPNRVPKTTKVMTVNCWMFSKKDKECRVAIATRDEELPVIREEASPCCSYE